MTEPDRPVADPRIPRRAPRFLAAVLAVVATAAALIALNETMRRDELAPPAVDPSTSPVGARFSLIDQLGRTTTDRSFAGRKRLMIFAPAANRDDILAALQVINSARDLLGHRAESLAAIWIVTDPERSTPEDRARILAEAGGDWTALTGPKPRVEALMRSFFVPRPQAGAHDAAAPKGAPPSSVTLAYLMDEEGRFLSHRTVSPDPAAIALWLQQSL